MSNFGIFDSHFWPFEQVDEKISAEIFFLFKSIDMVKKFKVGIMQNPKHPNKVSRRFLEKLKEVILVGICKKTVTKFKHHHNNNNNSKHQKFPWLKIMEIKLFGKKLEL